MPLAGYLLIVWDKISIEKADMPSTVRYWVFFKDDLHCLTKLRIAVIVIVHYVFSLGTII
jgi:hypothetical protein